jgi:hypothetical protein
MGAYLSAPVTEKVCVENIYMTAASQTGRQGWQHFATIIVPRYPWISTLLDSMQFL